MGFSLRCNPSRTVLLTTNHLSTTSRAHARESNLGSDGRLRRREDIPDGQTADSCRDGPESFSRLAISPDARRGTQGHLEDAREDSQSAGYEGTNVKIAAHLLKQAGVTLL